MAKNQTLYSGFIQFGAGLAVGLSCLAAGIAIGITGDAGVRATAQQPRMFVGMVCCVYVKGKKKNGSIFTLNLCLDFDSDFR